MHVYTYILLQMLAKDSLVEDGGKIEHVSIIVLCLNACTYNRK